MKPSKKAESRIPKVSTRLSVGFTPDKNKQLSYMFLPEELFQEMSVKIVFDTGEEMTTCVSSRYTMIAVGISLHFELYVRLYEFFSQFGRILEMDVIIGQSMTDEQVAMQFLVAVKR